MSQKSLPVSKTGLFFVKNSFYYKQSYFVDFNIHFKIILRPNLSLTRMSICDNVQDQRGMKCMEISVSYKMNDSRKRANFDQSDFQTQVDHLPGIYRHGRYWYPQQLITRYMQILMLPRNEERQTERRNRSRASSRVHARF